MAKKGVSAEEKKTRMLELFYETGECYQLKELEKVAPKLKGIVANSVKDVIQKLLDDALIDSDKIGTSVYYWSFPGKAMKTRKRKLDEVSAQYEKTSKKLKMLQETIQDNPEDNDSDKLNQCLAEITTLELDIETLKKKLKEHEENDPDKFYALKEQTVKLVNATNRWTDNIFAVKSWCKKKFMIEDKVLDKQFGIPEDLDYIE